MTIQYPEIMILVGSGRSGTTYLAGLLRACFDIGIPSEPKFVIPLSKKIYKYGNLAEPRNMQLLIEAILRSPPFEALKRENGVVVDPSELLENLQGPTYTDVLYTTFRVLANKTRKSRLGYKDPYDVVNLPALARLFPTARFIHIIRDGRDVALSLLRFQWGPTNLYSAARYWAEVTAKGCRDGNDLESRYYQVKYEDLITETQKVAWELGTFINRGQNTQQVSNFVKQVELSKKVENIQLWKHKLDRRQIYLCEAAAGQELRDFGYNLLFEGKPRLNWADMSGYLAKDFLFRSLNRLRRNWRSITSECPKSS